MLRRWYLVPFESISDNDTYSLCGGWMQESAIHGINIIGTVSDGDGKVRANLKRTFKKHDDSWRKPPEPEAVLSLEHPVIQYGAVKVSVSSSHIITSTVEGCNIKYYNSCDNMY